MGLRKSADSATVDQTAAAATVAPAIVKSAAPSFEPEVISANDAAVAGVSAAPAAATAVVVAPSGILPALGAKYAPALQGFKDVIDPSSLDFDTFKRVTCGLDGFSDDQKKEMGKQVKMQLMSWNERYIVTTTVDNDEANALVKYSLDGKSIDGTGQLVADYIKFLVSEGYESACSKKYYALYGFLVATSPEGALTEVPAADREIVAVQVAPRSVAQFTAYQLTHGVKVSQGLVKDTDLLLLTQEKKTGKVKAYASIKFSAAY